VEVDKGNNMTLEVSPYPVEQIQALSDLDFLPLVPLRYRRPLLQGTGLGAFRCLLAKSGEKSAGVVLATVSPRTRRGKLLALYVAPEFRRSGVGSRLLSQLEMQVYWAGCDAIDLEYSPENSTAQAWEAMLRAQGWEGPPVAGTVGAAGRTKSLSHLAAIAGSREAVPAPANDQEETVSSKAFLLLHRWAEKLIAEFSRDGKGTSSR
jgi:GNAT superfamily N-acetyltransferase